MRITKKQKEEIDFLCRLCGDTPIIPEAWEVEEYLNHTVLGKKMATEYCEIPKNRIFRRKRKWDILLKMYQEDLKREIPLVFKEEILGWYSHHPFIIKVVSKLSYV